MIPERYKPYVIVFTLAVILSYAVFCNAAEIMDKIVAIVNDEVITQSELDEVTMFFLADYEVAHKHRTEEERFEKAREDALNRLIEEALLFQQAKNIKVEIDEAELEKRISQIKASFQTEEEFREALKASGMTMEALKEKHRKPIIIRELVNMVIAEKVRISPTQVAAYYYGHKSEFKESPRVRFNIIFVRFKSEAPDAATKGKAEKILKRLNAGEDFAELAKDLSEGPNASEGGDMGFVEKGDMAEEIDEVIFKLEPGEISELIETPSGYAIVKVEEKTPSLELTLAEASDIVRNKLFQREAELAIREYMDFLKENAYIKIKEFE
ncbi:MAG TPA: hypothetical protein ENN78_02110 [Candidatus Omnitrophica bacterium]|nr:hypothetical protein [Candidatus Omnitrophota bacterium]